jgi:hypothetical protein
MLLQADGEGLADNEAWRKVVGGWWVEVTEIWPGPGSLFSECGDQGARACIRSPASHCRRHRQSSRKPRQGNRTTRLFASLQLLSSALYICSSTSILQLLWSDGDVVPSSLEAHRPSSVQISRRARSDFATSQRATGLTRIVVEAVSLLSKARDLSLS